MDAGLNAAARQLSLGDPLGALERVALRDDAPALALRGIAMAQLGELKRADELLRRAARAFEPGESLFRARAIVARAEVRLAARELSPVPGLDEALATLDAQGDRINALHARLLAARRSLLLGRVDDAEATLIALDLDAAPAMLVAIGELVATDIALRRMRPRPARAHATRALAAAQRSRIPALAAEAALALAQLDAPAARQRSGDDERVLTLDQVEAVLASDAMIVDGCRRVVRMPGLEVGLARRPVLFALARTLASVWPAAASRHALLLEAFGVRRANESHRARLRVEIGRLRRELAALAEIHATPDGFALVPRDARPVVSLLPPIDGEAAALLALLADGQAWSTSALALALGTSQRTVQRALSALEQASRVQRLGRARSLRWLAPPVSGFTTTLLLPAADSAG
ncbi:MAG: hypothetical protein WKG01_14675 [Kofleriaceae bacterium]